MTWAYWWVSGRAATRMVSGLRTGAAAQTSFTAGSRPIATRCAMASAGSLHLSSAQVLDCDTTVNLGHLSVIELSPNAELLPSISLNFNWYIVRSRHAVFHRLFSSVRSLQIRSLSCSQTHCGHPAEITNMVDCHILISGWLHQYRTAKTYYSKSLHHADISFTSDSPWKYVFTILNIEYLYVQVAPKLTLRSLGSSAHLDEGNMLTPQYRSVKEPIPWLIKGMDGLFHYPGPSNIQGWHLFFSSFFFPQWWGCWGFPPGWWQFLTQPTTLTATRQLKNITRVQERSSTSPRTAFGWCLLHSKTVKPLYLLLNCILQ